MEEYSSQSRVWIYLSDKAFNDDEVIRLNQDIEQFCIQWTAHGANLKARGEVLHHNFILLMVDESSADASGCSIDKSVHFIRQIEKDFGVNLFERLIFAWKAETDIRVSHLNDLQKLVDAGEITMNTIVFNPLVASKKEFDESFQIPLRNSWMAKRIHLNKQVV